MPWHYLAKKDATTCEKLWGAGSKQRTVDIRMGEPNINQIMLSCNEYIVALK